MDALSYFPFTRLRLPAGEAVLWCGTNPTFHRATWYGIAVSAEAVYLYREMVPFSFFSRWTRIPMTSISDVAFQDSVFMPRLRIISSGRPVVLRTPWDNSEDMCFDRKTLKEAVEAIQAQLGGRVLPDGTPHLDRQAPP